MQMLRHHFPADSRLSYQNIDNINSSLRARNIYVYACIEIDCRHEVVCDRTNASVCQDLVLQGNIITAF